jgi:hypothetical protein
MSADSTQARDGRPERRVALVIGNGKYVNAPALDNPPSDAGAIAQVLRELHFEVIDGYDLDVEAMDARITEFARRISDADAALFFFAGHGLQVNGENYLVPIDAKLDHEGQLRRQTFRLQDELNMMSGRSAVSIVLLDCCRDNPYMRSLAGGGPNRTRGGMARGLAEVGVDEGSFIAFATGPGSVAKDGDGEHSPFTEALLKHIAAPGQSLADIMTDVASAVTAATDRQQVPWYHSSLQKRFYFIPAGAPAAPVKAKPEPMLEPAPALKPQKASNGKEAVNLVSDGSGAYRAPSPGNDDPRGARTGVPKFATGPMAAVVAAIVGVGGLAVYFGMAPSKAPDLPAPGSASSSAPDAGGSSLLVTNDNQPLVTTNNISNQAVQPLQAANQPATKGPAPLKSSIDRPPQSGWCYQKDNSLLGPEQPYVLTCYTSEAACYSYRGYSLVGDKSDCTFQESLDDGGVQLKPGLESNSWSAQASTPFPAPFPPLSPEFLFKNGKSDANAQQQPPATAK